MKYFSPTTPPLFFSGLKKIFGKIFEIGIEFYRFVVCNKKTNKSYEIK
jgi:hypothetical protein